MYSQASIANEKDSPPQLEIPSSTGGTKGSTDGVPNATPQDLSDKRGLLGQGHINDTETRSSSLSDNNILRLEELPNAGPQVRLRNDVVGLIGSGIDEWRDGNLLSDFPEFSQFGRQVGNERLKADSRVECMQNSGMIAVKLVREGRSAVSNVRQG